MKDVEKIILSEIDFWVQEIFKRTFLDVTVFNWEFLLSLDANILEYLFSAIRCHYDFLGS